MLVRPDQCRGCALDPLASGFMQHTVGKLPIVLMGEALGKAEAARGVPFVGAAGFQAGRLLRHIDLTPEDFSWINAVWCRPPKDKLEGQWYAEAAIEQCKQYWQPVLRTLAPQVIVPMGNVPLYALTGKRDILKARGYPQWSQDWNCWIVPSVHPSFILRGQTQYATCFITDIQKAVRIAREGGLEQHLTTYLIDPTPADALAWGRAWWERAQHVTDWNDPSSWVLWPAYDIETPKKAKAEEEDEIEESDEPDPITRISFSYEPYSAISVPWAPEYMAFIRLMLETPSGKVVWNGSFDNPRIREAGVKILGRQIRRYDPTGPGFHALDVIDDAMWAWHILQSDQRKGLGHVASMVLHDQLAWKHLAGSALGLYNCVDSDVTKRLWMRIAGEMLKA